MSDKTASFQSKRKSLRGSLIPGLEDLFRGQPVERDIQFDRIKIVRIEFEPFSLGDAGRVESSIPPMGIVITARANMDHISDGGWVQGFEGSGGQELSPEKILDSKPSPTHP